MVKKLIGVIFGLDHESKRVFEIGEMMEFVVIVSGEVDRVKSVGLIAVADPALVLSSP
mgnify:CR=1 FL=1